MRMGRLEKLERLQKLRESGALDEDEFAQEKQRLLSTGKGSGRAPAIAIILLLLAGILAAGLWYLRGSSGPPAEDSWQDAPVIETMSNEVAGPRSPEQRLADAFEAATGRRAQYSEMKDGEEISTKPLRIIELPFGPALLTERTIKDGCHACTGAIGVFYLDETDGRTEVKGHWPEAVQGWGWGAPPSSWRVTDKFTAFPAIFAEGGFMGQGVVMESATITELQPSGPATSEYIGTGFSNEGAIVDNERPVCKVEGKIANIRKDRSFDVIASGSVRAVDRYVKRGGKFVATAKIDWGIPCDRENEPADFDPFAD